MNELRGTISERELKTYDGAEIILLQNSNNETISDISGSLSGEGTYTWDIAWDENGFVGQNWEAFNGINLVNHYGSVAEVIARIQADPINYAISVATTNILAHDAGCASAKLTSS